MAPDEVAQARVAELTQTERDVLARAAIFGTTFWAGGVTAMARLDGKPSCQTTVFSPDRSIEQTRRTLANLEERGYLVRSEPSALAGESEWSFVQGLERELRWSVAERYLS